MHREFLKVLDMIMSPWEMWEGEQMSVFKIYFYITTLKKMKFNLTFLIIAKKATMNYAFVANAGGALLVNRPLVSGGERSWS